MLVLSFLPAAVVGYTLERPDRAAPRRPEGDRLRPARRRGGDAGRRPPAQLRGRGEAAPADGLALGVAQAAALAPGVSRNGVTLAAARWRRFSRDQANLLSRTIALPIIVGATGAQGRPAGAARHHAGAAALAGVGIAASFASTLASQRLIGLVERDRALWPYAAYRSALAPSVLAKLRRASRPLRDGG